MPDGLAVSRHFYVDEAGDSTLFDRRGTIIVGREGVSKTFMVGICELSDPALADRSLRALREELTRDPYFRGVPSMLAAANKTAQAFHAKDDLPEVRREVFRCIAALNPRIVVALRHKAALALSMQTRYRATGIRYSPAQLYDELVARVCEEILGDGAEHRFLFARRGKAERNSALTRTIQSADSGPVDSAGSTGTRRVVVAVGVPSQSAGLQVADYLLWALQRLVERGEDRYFYACAPAFRLVMDLDDVRHNEGGERYSEANPLTREKLKPVAHG